jgi:hypothetical protein
VENIRNVLTLFAVLLDGKPCAVIYLQIPPSLPVALVRELQVWVLNRDAPPLAPASPGALLDRGEMEGQWDGSISHGRHGSFS